MNIRNVLRTYSLLRQLTDDESALLETLRELNDAERESLVVALQPEKVTGKRASKKASSRSSSKSPRAQSLSGAIQRAGKGRVDDDEDGPRCTYLMGDDAPCNATEHSPVHKQDGGYLNWHEFQPGKSDAPPAPRRSSANGGAGSTTANSATGTEDVSSAVHAGG